MFPDKVLGPENLPEIGIHNSFDTGCSFAGGRQLIHVIKFKKHFVDLVFSDFMFGIRIVFQGDGFNVFSINNRLEGAFHGKAVWNEKVG